MFVSPAVELRHSTHHALIAYYHEQGLVWQDTLKPVSEQLIHAVTLMFRVDVLQKFSLNEIASETNLQLQYWIS